jgi:hypothetical protein
MEIIEKMKDLNSEFTRLVEDITLTTLIQDKEEIRIILGSLIEDLIELDDQLSVLE